MRLVASVVQVTYHTYLQGKPSREKPYQCAGGAVLSISIGLNPWAFSSRTSTPADEPADTRSATANSAGRLRVRGGEGEQADTPAATAIVVKTASVRKKLSRPPASLPSARSFIPYLWNAPQILQQSLMGTATRRRRHAHTNQCRADGRGRSEICPNTFCRASFSAGAAFLPVGPRLPKATAALNRIVTVTQQINERLHFRALHEH